MQTRPMHALIGLERWQHPGGVDCSADLGICGAEHEQILESVGQRTIVVAAIEEHNKVHQC